MVRNVIVVFVLIFCLIQPNIVKATAPSNDNFANATSLTGSSGDISGTNAEATKESGEPNHAGVQGGASAWFKWTATSSHIMEIDTNGSDFDTQLAVYTGTDVSHLTSIASNDDYNDAMTSQVIFPIKSGTTYYIAIDGYLATTGNYALHYETHTAVRMSWLSSGGILGLWDYDTSTHFASLTPQTLYGPNTSWTFNTTSDDSLGNTKIFWTNGSNAASLWTLDNTTGQYTSATYGPYTGWTPLSIAIDGSNIAHVLWRNSNGSISIWNLDGSGAGGYSYHNYGPFTNWTCIGFTTGYNNIIHLVWQYSSGATSIWHIDMSHPDAYTYHNFSTAGWTLLSLSVYPNNNIGILWNRSSDNLASFWTLNYTTGSFSFLNYGPYTGWSTKSAAVDSDGYPHILWAHTSGLYSLWDVYNTSTGDYTYTLYGPYTGWECKAVSTRP